MALSGGHFLSGTDSRDFFHTSIFKWNGNYYQRKCHLRQDGGKQSMNLWFNQVNKKPYAFLERM